MKAWNLALILTAVVAVAQGQPRACGIWVDGSILAPSDAQLREPICPFFGDRAPDIARGSILVVTGSNLGPQVEVTNPGFPLSTSLAGVSIRLTVAGTPIDTFVLSVQEHRVRALVPSPAPLGEGAIVVTYGGDVSGPSRVRIVPRNFLLYWLLPRHNISADGEWRENRFTGPARPGQPLVLWGTGLGAVGVDEATEVGPSPAITPDLEVRVGLERARILYAGRSACCAGVDQIVIETPSGIEGCHVPVVVRFPSEERLSNYTSVAIASSAATCSDPHGMPESARALLEASGNAVLGTIALGQDGWFPDGVSAAFYRANDHIRIPLGTCGAVSGNILFSPVDAGPGLKFAGPFGEWAVPEQPDVYVIYRFYHLDFPTDELAPGTYSINNGDGGPGIGPFTFTSSVAAPSLQWTNRDVLGSVAKGEDLTITWETGEPADGYIDILGTSLIFPPGEPNGYGLGGFHCLERADRGRFAVPSWVLWNASRASATSLDIAVRHYVRREFTAPGLDFGEFVHVRPAGSVRAAIVLQPR